VMGILGAPLIPLSWYVLSVQQQTVEETTRRLAGMHMAAAAFDLATDLNQQWIATERGQPLPQTSAVADHARLQQSSRAASEAGLPVQQTWERHRPALERVLALGSVPAEARPVVLTLALQALVELHKVAAAAAAVDASQDRQLSAQAGLALIELPALQAELCARWRTPTWEPTPTPALPRGTS